MSLLLASVVSLAVHTHGPVPTVEQLLNKVHAPRTGITRYEVVIDARGAEGKARANLRRVWRDGDRYREDHLTNFEPDGTFRRRIDSTNAPENGQHFFLANGRADIRSLAHVKVHIDTRFRFEGLGATPESATNQAHERDLKWWADQKEWTEKRVERCCWKGHPAYKLVLEGPNHAMKPVFETTVLPRCGFAPIHSRMTCNEKDAVSTWMAESELVRVAGVWLPAKSVYQERTGDKVLAKLDQTIYYSLNKPVASKVFSLEGLDLPSRTPVQTPDGPMKWDGEKLVPDR